MAESRPRAAEHARANRIIFERNLQAKHGHIREYDDINQGNQHKRMQLPPSAEDVQRPLQSAGPARTNAFYHESSLLTRQLFLEQGQKTKEEWGRHSTKPNFETNALGYPLKGGPQKLPATAKFHRRTAWHLPGASRRVNPSSCANYAAWLRSQYAWATFSQSCKPAASRLAR